MTGPINNQSIFYSNFQSQQLAWLIKNMQSNPQDMALAFETIALSIKIQSGTSTLQERITFLDQIAQLFPGGMERMGDEETRIGPDQATGQAQGKPLPATTNWNQLILNFFAHQVGALLDEALQETIQQGQSQTKKQAVRSQTESQDPVKPSYAQPKEEAAGRSFTQQTGQTRQNEAQPAAQNPTAAQHTKSNRQLFAETAVKLLSVNQLGQMRVGGQSNVLPHIQMAVQLNQILSKLEELKQSLQNQNAPHLEAVLKTASERIKESLEVLQKVVQQNPHPPVGNGEKAPQALEAEQRLEQDFLLLSSFLAGVDPKAKQAAMQNSGRPEKQPALAPNFVIPQSDQKNAESAAKPALNSPVLPQTDRQMPVSAPVIPARAESKTLTTLLPIQAPRTNADAVTLIQAHLNRGIMQPLPIILPFPVTFTMNKILDITASAVEKEKAKNQEGEKRGSGGGGVPLSTLMMLIPAGPVLVGDHLDEGRRDEKPVRIEQLEAFLIGAMPVTNGEYAAWVSDELVKGNLQLEMPGKIYNKKGILLAHTIEGAPLSQLEIATEGGLLRIRALAGRENHPVVHVTHEGALAYAQANGFRLPSDLEWERAAGMLPTEYGQPLKKLRYGNGSDTISPETAAYKETAGEKITMNLTMPVGFFDGQKVYTKAGKRVETKLSVSPWGCYDMSGNAREWTMSSYDEEGYLMITKGGSYADTAFDLRVAAKIPLPRQTSDPYTTFRVAL